MALTRREFLGLSAATLGTCNPRAFATKFTSRLADPLDAYVTKSMSDWKVPGLALAVVHRGELLAVRGYGVRSADSDARVDATTVFPIASCSKAFTASTVALLVDRGKLDWDDPVARHLSMFRSPAEWIEHVTVRQALSHRTGLPRANMLWRSGAFSSSEILERVCRLSPVAAPGTRFIYNNNLYLVAGKLVEQISGRMWSEFLSDELLQPLEMSGTVVGMSGIAGINNVAAPHRIDEEGRVQRIARYCPDVIAPAGAIHSNVIDLAKWLILHLEKRASNGKRILSNERFREVHAAPPSSRTRASVATDGTVPAAPVTRYGLGWFFNEYAGRTVVEHSGTANGFVAWTAMVPNERLGLVVLANQHRTGLNYALRHWILDAVLDRPERDWSEEIRNDYANGYQRLLREAKAQFESTRHPTLPPSLPLATYAGTFESKLYPDLQITARDGELDIQFGTRFRGRMEPWRNEAFRAMFDNPLLDDWLVSFTVENGNAIHLHAQESPWAPAWYEDADDLGRFDRR